MKQQKLGWRLAAVVAVVVIGILWFVPNFVDTTKMWWPTKDKMTLGLDIQGGLHLVLRADVPGALKQEANRIVGTIRSELQKDGIPFQDVTLGDASRGQITVKTSSVADSERVVKKVSDLYGPTFGTTATASGANLEFTELHIREFQKGTVERAIETIRNRIDEFGVAEPSITAQGSDRILVQLPGIQDAANAKELINKTARLDFMIVNKDYLETVNPSGFERLMGLIAEAETAGNFKLGGEIKYTAYVERLNEALKGKLPAGSLVLFEKPDNAATMEDGRIPYVLMSTETVPGDLLTDAFVAPGETGSPVVSFRLDAAGGRLMGAMTEKHRGEQMAIVLDRVVKSAPTIQSQITTQGQITLGRRGYEETMKEAKTLSITLKSGALPAALEQLEERTDGPTVGADAIQKGQFGAMVGGLLVFTFMLIYYRTCGLISNLSLILNLVLTMAVLSALGATLTLPGIAGLALGLGMAVDANVLIYERIKEELRNGVPMSSAVSIGYDKAFSAIFDSQVTSIAVCIVLMYYGTGAIRGFAVTLMTGLFITLFTAVFFTRTVFDLLVVRMKLTPSIKW
ncbi:MAG: protein translocase subunit SecD [Bdellovibrionales bacterium]|nr:protein translocase subunit SecD [Bdellovibrionales bacterium]